MNIKNILPLTALFWTACLTDLPVGWEDATPIDQLQQSECEGDPYELEENNEESLLSGGIENGELQLQFSKADFRCDQEVEGFHMVEDGALSILIQPQDMNPSMVAKCNCLYNIDLSIPGLGEIDTIDVYKRSDRYGGEPSMTYVDTMDFVSEE
tara:strand:+ start:96 stop:557 length:462 start_codon:yes stop_codon:yes gene_type:complete